MRMSKAWLSRLACGKCDGTIADSHIPAHVPASWIAHILGATPNSVVVYTRPKAVSLSSHIRRHMKSICLAVNSWQR